MTLSCSLPALSLMAGLSLLAGSSASANHGSASEVSTENKTVKVTCNREGNVTHFLVENRELGDITMTFEMHVKNLQGKVSFPYTATFAPGKTTEAFALQPCDPDGKWEYSFTNYFKLGSSIAQHDDNFAYELPYAAGNKFKVTQAYGGKFSHTGSNQYAIDWQMPEGTLVLAARGGTVVRVKDDSDKGGASMDYDRYNNYILIRHDDGTLAHYCHLQKGGCLVKPGQKVAIGDAIAHSGNTGFSSGPHLHLCVFKTKDGKQRLSLPVKFRTANEPAETLFSGRSYRAPETGGGVVQARVQGSPTPVGGSVQN